MVQEALVLSKASKAIGSSFSTPWSMRVDLDEPVFIAWNGGTMVPLSSLVGLAKANAFVLEQRKRTMRPMGLSNMQSHRLNLRLEGRVKTN